MIQPLITMNFQLREWQDRDFLPIREAEKKVEAIGRKAGKGSNDFRNACRRLLEVTLNGQGESLESHISQSVDIRAFAYLLSASDPFSRSVKISQGLLAHLLTVRYPMSRLTLTQLIRAYIEKFDQVANEKELVDWGEFIRQQLANVPVSKSVTELKNYAKYSDTIFSLYGPSRVVQYSHKEATDFNGIMERFSLTGFPDSRYLKLCRYQYYLETLKTIKVGENHSVLAEVCHPDVIGAAYSSDK